MFDKIRYFALPLGFFLGVYLAEDVRSLRSNLYYKPQEGFFSRPYDLRVEKRSLNDRVEVYLTDVRTGDFHMIGPEMFVGSPSHRINSVINIPREYAKKKNLGVLLSLIELYDSLFD